MIFTKYSQAYATSKADLNNSNFEKHGKIITYAILDSCNGIEKVSGGYKVESYTNLRGFRTETFKSLSKAKAEMTINTGWIFR